MDLEWQDLKLLDRGFWANDVKEALIVGYETGLVDYLVAIQLW